MVHPHKSTDLPKDNPDAVKNLQASMDALVESECVAHQARAGGAKWRA